MGAHSLYSTIDRRINADEWFRNLSRDGKYVWLRLLTGQHVTPVAGLWPATEEGLARALQMTLKEFRDAFKELGAKQASNGLPRVLADWNAGVIWLPNSLKTPSNQPKNPNVLNSWKQHVELIPECPLKTQALQHLKTWVQQNRNRFKSVPGWLASHSDSGTGTGTGTGETPNSPPEGDDVSSGESTNGVQETKQANLPLGGGDETRARRWAAKRVFDAWKLDTGHHRSTLDPKREKRLMKALEHFSEDECIRIIQNRRNDPFLMGVNDTGRKFDGIDTLFRDRAQCERLLELNEPLKPPPSSRGAPSSQPKQPNAGAWKPPVEHAPPATTGGTP